MGKTKIMWHGTSYKNGVEILKTGFAPWTYFARHAEDAFGMGGPMLFMVSCDVDFGEEGWQMRIRRRWSTKRILRVFRISLSRHSPTLKPYLCNWNYRVRRKPRG